MAVGSVQGWCQMSLVRSDPVGKEKQVSRALPDRGMRGVVARITAPASGVNTAGPLQAGLTLRAPCRTLFWGFSHTGELVLLRDLQPLQRT